jgi:hypothetical protein
MTPLPFVRTCVVSVHVVAGESRHAGVKGGPGKREYAGGGGDPSGRLMDDKVWLAGWLAGVAGYLAPQLPSLRRRGKHTPR